MKTLSAANAAEYLKNRGMDLAAPRVTELGGGVSNTVLLVESDGQAFVLKQALGKLRVQEDWFAAPRACGSRGCGFAALGRPACPKVRSRQCCLRTVKISCMR